MILYLNLDQRRSWLDRVNEKTGRLITAYRSALILEYPETESRFIDDPEDVNFVDTYLYEIKFTNDEDKMRFIMEYL